ncbi:MAG TPA: M48 family metalloprotease [Planctomycetota bacterium]|nr:M48 family metalloprotease [Planctomycetota bacterium]
MRIFVPCLVAAALAGCGGSAKLTESQEYYMGRGVAAMAIEKDQLWTTDQFAEYLSLVGLTVAFESDRPETYKGYTFAVLNTETVNAFAGPSGFIFVTKGALRQMQSEDELAGVLAHEIAHVNLRHPELAAQRASDKEGLSEYAGKFTSMASTLFSLAGKQQYADLAQKAGPVFGKTVTGLHEQFANGYSRDEEFAADRMAVEFMTRPGVGYDPNAFKSFISRLPAKGGAWGTHPGLEGRVKAIEEAIQSQGSRVAPTDPSRTQRFLAMKVALGQ